MKTSKILPAKYTEFVRRRCELLGIKATDVKDALDVSRSYSFQIVSGEVGICHDPKKLSAFADLLLVKTEILVCLEYEILLVNEKILRPGIQAALERSENFGELRKVLSADPDPAEGIEEMRKELRGIVEELRLRKNTVAKFLKETN